MSSIIHSLHELVSPKVLQLTAAQAGSDESKKNALEVLYRLFTARLSDENVVSSLNNLNDDELEDGEKLLSLAMTGNKTGETDFLTRLYDNVGEKFNLPAATISGLSVAALPLAFSHIKSLAGSKPIAAYVGEEKDSLIAGLPNWLSALLPAGLLGAFAAIGGGVSGLASSAVGVAGKAVSGVADGVSDVAQGAADMAGKAVHGVADGASKVAGAVGDELKDLKDGVGSVVSSATSSGGGFMKSLLPIIGVIILAGLGWLMLKGCQKEPTPVAAPSPSAETAVQSSTNAVAPVVALAPATLALGLNEAGDSLFTCRGTTGNGLGEQWKTTIASVFGGGDCQIDTKETVDVKSPVTEAALAQILGFMKGVPDATLSINDKTVRFNSSNPDALQKLISDVKTAFPDLVVEAEPALNVEEAVKNSIDAAKSALDGLGSDATIDDLVNALNLQIINFASASAEIPADNQAVLDKAAERLKTLDAKLLITGHTDSQGSFESNQALSERRAKAVHDYLVSKGVGDDKLEVKGASSSNPVATNATEQGRFANRRIEFTVFKDGEVVAEVGNTTATSGEVKADTEKK